MAEAIVVLERACIEAERAQHLALLATNRVRFAIALQCADRHEEAIAQHEAAIDLIDTQRIRRLKDFALQHLGKCHVDRGDFETARQCFQRALRLRKRRGDIELIASTELALAELERLDSAMNQGNT